ncbi:STE20-like serine/threonine-protein kinase isoform X1 [Rhodamnia argentea]|uniref:STE20-like serine/threonine-protein kinase isoform X1 n=1 Tax=Rhodamnia argentea TaxID=178133 RepID=A0A8B8P8C1_9MYRT|nr:STE20-like serine/threonine-protein kinase isoform X1 [Rhodamnia argentea]XP_030530880.1 STE20-like serine/threonine-protein kinase isoform X1 [Rhodamnia argentea]
MEPALEKKYPVNAKDYKLYEEVGEGVSATVYRALCIPFNEIVAVKVLDLERCNNDLDGIRREVQTMSLISHPNLLQAHCSFTAGHGLWVVMPYMKGGSCLHIMKSAFPEGFEEPVISSLLHEVLKALVYLHSHGHIHRDVKSGNILVNSNGFVKLADFGVSACMFDAGDRQRSRNTFVGTPCWMAPEVMQQLHGYDFKADIWSFGITALELAHGHAPFSKYPPMKVLLMTLQNAPPGLDYERDKRFSKSFKEMVATCLVKDPKKRPTAEKLLKHPFFKRARAANYLAQTILEGLAPLGDRFRTLKAKEADLLVQNKALYEDKEQLSQQEYIRGISAWNFNLEDLKNQAALIQDDDINPNAEDVKQKQGHCDVGIPAGRLSPNIIDQAKVAPNKKDPIETLHDLEDSLAPFPIKPVQALKACFDVREVDVNATSPNWKGTRSDSEEQFPTKSSPKGTQSDIEEQLPTQCSSRAIDTESRKNEGDHLEPSGSLPPHAIPEDKKLLSGPQQSDNVPSPEKLTFVDVKRRDHQQPKYQSELHRQKKDSDVVLPVEDTSEVGVVQRKGRFQVTSADLSAKGPVSCLSGTACSGSSNFTSPNIATGTLLPSLQAILQQNITQRDEIVKMIKYVEQLAVKPLEIVEAGINEQLQASPASAKERDLQSQLVNLQQSVQRLDEELQRQRTKNFQLVKQLSFLAKREERLKGQ